MSKGTILNGVGFLFPGGFTLLTFIEKMTPVLQFFGLVVTIAVGITVAILNIKKIQSQKKDDEIKDKLLKDADG